MEHFTNMLCDHRKKYGCEHVLVKPIDLWKYALNDDNCTGTLVIDLSKAFDCLTHGLLLQQ